MSHQINIKEFRMTTETVEKEPVDTIEQANLVAPKAEPTTPQKPLTEAEIIALAAKHLPRAARKKRQRPLNISTSFVRLERKGISFIGTFAKRATFFSNGMANIGKNSLKNRPRMILQHG